MLYSIPRSCLIHPVKRFDSEGWFSSDQVIFFNCVSCFLVKKHAAFKWKDAISRFPVSPGSAEALVNWGGKIKYILIAYFLGNICAKNCRNRTVYVKIIASQRRDVFWDTVYIAKPNIAAHNVITFFVATFFHGYELIRFFLFQFSLMWDVILMHMPSS